MMGPLCRPETAFLHRQIKFAGWRYFYFYGLLSAFSPFSWVYLGSGGHSVTE